jgi:DNA-binding transcriptional regulator/RsmH inhibitor MraZ
VAEIVFDNSKLLSLKQPLGNFETRCDEKGRVRLPSSWVHFFTHELKDNRVFTTSFGDNVIRIYPESIWRFNLELFERQSDFSEDVESVLNLANHYGAQTELDANGRVLIDPGLRAELALLGDQVVGTGKKGVIHVYRQVDYTAMIGAAKKASAGAIHRLTKLGMR